MATVVQKFPVAPLLAPVTISDERPEDAVLREALLDRAMGVNRKRKASETIRRGRKPAEGLSFVARKDDGSLIGTVRLWTVQAGISPEGRPIPALLLGPLAVDPGEAGRGIGSALMRVAITEAKRRGHGAIILVGDPAYYERFGFSAAPTATLAMPGPFERHRFQGLNLIEGWLTGAAGMIVATGETAR